MALAIDHLKRGKMIVLNKEKYVAEKRPMVMSLCTNCKMLGAAKQVDAKQQPVCILCTYLDWNVRKQPYRLRLKKVEK